MDSLLYLGNSDISYIDSLYSKYKKNPDELDAGWRKFFEGFEFSKIIYADNNEKYSLSSSEFNVIDLINAYRERGHLFTLTNPVRTRRKYAPNLDIVNFGLNDNDIDQSFLAGNEIGIGKSKLSQIIDHLKQTYCQHIGVEYMYIRNPEIVEWLKLKFEQTKNTPSFDLIQKKEIYTNLANAVIFEDFIHKKFPGQKSFSLEGCEALIPAVNCLITYGANLGVEEFIFGMAHRGRLNMLTNILDKPFSNVFSEFEGKQFEDDFLGDVKYHLGFSNQIEINKKLISLCLVPNPSHLEAVGPVALGLARARIDNTFNGNNKNLLPIIIHGDASIAGQGVVYELIQMSQLEGYSCGGSIHLVINNQIGFTTNYLDARSSTYCTDVAKTIQVPIFHVNADDVEAVSYIIQLAVEFRQKFHRDVFIDLLGYRKFGHNESDEPRFTQPILYKAIEKHPNPLNIYKHKLFNELSLDESFTIDYEKQFLSQLEEAYQQSKSINKEKIESFLSNIWIKQSNLDAFNPFDSIKTNISQPTLLNLANKITFLPSHLNFFKKTIKLMRDRIQMITEFKQVDWAMAELLAYASLIEEGFFVRISGQDVKRGTFSHRHAVLTVEDSEEQYTALNHISSNPKNFQIYNSPLSEYAVLGFEYGYSLASPDTLNIWEAQFGDFANVAQVIFDQFISSAEEKWKIFSGINVFLPHGYEGQGPEHSSARIERYLDLCAENNMQIVVCSEPANLFHLLRRQIHRNHRKPLILFTPKSLLRNPLCVSKIENFTEGGFKEIIVQDVDDFSKMNKIILCYGKIFYELSDFKQMNYINDLIIVRIEQLYPFPINQIEALLNKLNPNIEKVFVQEEPENMGAWYFVQRILNKYNFRRVSRPLSGSTATGSSKFHVLQQKKIIEKAFNLCDCNDVCNDCKTLCLSNTTNNI